MNLNMPKIIDVTRPIHPALAVWPGDSPYSHQWVMRMDRGDSVNVSTLTLSAHTGTHVDAPLHFSAEGGAIGVQPLDAYLGLAQVIEIPKTGPIHPQDLVEFDLGAAPRLLVKSPASARAETEWNEEIIYPTPPTIDMLAQQGIMLFGTDAPSVDPIQSKTLDAHHRLAAHHMAILENLALAMVPPGIYELIALPLALPVDGSPVRAVLRTLE